ncbi:MAG: type II toxin-antitoxin system YafQ family toxin [Phycisphaerae bacterium]|nr:type II toxin-antitoxin system YafQ family toxin [Phycisphaerae bacterium]
MKILRTNQFRKDYKRAKKQKKNLSLLKDVIRALVSGQELAARYTDHPLTGAMKRYRELHIRPDWLLIYEIREGELSLLRLGSHSELFRS